jgi:hypothetical protein
MGNTCQKKLQNSQERFIPSNQNSKCKINSEKESYKEYFKLIKTKLRQFYEENQNNQFNISISLDKKDFNTVTTAKKIYLNPNQKFIYWKDFLLHYLNKQTVKGCVWSGDLAE